MKQLELFSQQDFHGNDPADMIKRKWKKDNGYELFGAYSIIKTTLLYYFCFLVIYNIVNDNSLWQWQFPPFN